MAVVRARSAPPYGLFAAVTFAVLATAAAVIFYVMWTKATDEHDRLAKERDDSRNASALVTTANTGLTKELASANQKISSLTKEVAAKDTAISDLTRTFASDTNAVKAAQGQVMAIQKQFDALKTSTGQSDSSVRMQLAQAISQRDAAVKKAQADLNDALQKAEDDRRTLVLQLEDAKSTIAKQSAEILDLRQRIINFGSGKTDVSVGEPDGKVIRVNNTTGEVYINLGKKDRLLAGMPFTAYDPRVGVRFGTDEQALGNGSIEVIQIEDNTAICRITRTTPNRAIQAGDLISNIVYHNDKTRKFRFTVFGDFDLDGDGVATAAERDRLVTLIQAWGGQVDDDVSSQTDFLVLGEKPKSPLVSDSTDTATTSTAPADAAAATTAPTAGVAGSVGDTRSKDQEKYDELEISAKRLAIPVLNQNRFLAMVGYYNTTVVRY